MGIYFKKGRCKTVELECDMFSREKRVERFQSERCVQTYANLVISVNKSWKHFGFYFDSHFGSSNESTSNVWGFQSMNGIIVQKKQFHFEHPFSVLICVTVRLFS